MKKQKCKKGYERKGERCMKKKEDLDILDNSVNAGILVATGVIG